MVFEEFPEPYTDAIYVEVNIRFGWIDRLRILFVGIVHVKVSTLCEVKPGKVESFSQVNVRSIKSLFPHKNIVYEAEREQPQ